MITDAQAIKFSNERARPLADRLCQLYFYSKALVAEFDANGLNKLFADSEVVDDGSDKDGRHPIIGLDVKTVVDLSRQYITDFESGVNAKLDSSLKVAVNPSKNT